MFSWQLSDWVVFHIQNRKHFVFRSLDNHMSVSLWMPSPVDCKIEFVLCILDAYRDVFHCPRNGTARPGFWDILNTWRCFKVLWLFPLQCFKMAETYEPDIEEWYYNLQDTEDLMKYICKDRYLKHAKWDDSEGLSKISRHASPEFSALSKLVSSHFCVAGCLDEVFVPKTDEEREREDKEVRSTKRPAMWNIGIAVLPLALALHHFSRLSVMTHVHEAAQVLRFVTSASGCCRRRRKRNLKRTRTRRGVTRTRSTG